MHLFGSFPGCVESSTGPLRRVRTRRGECIVAARWKGRRSGADAICRAVRAPAATWSLLTKHALLDQVWGHQFVSDSVLKTAISEIRTVLNDNARQPRFIETVSRRGYRFIAVPTATPVAPAARPIVSGIRSLQTESFIGRAEALSRLRNAWDLDPLVRSPYTTYLRLRFHGGANTGRPDE